VWQRCRCAPRVGVVEKRCVPADALLLHKKLSGSRVGQMLYPPLSTLERGRVQGGEPVGRGYGMMSWWGKAFSVHAPCCWGTRGPVVFCACCPLSSPTSPPPRSSVNRSTTAPQCADGSAPDVACRPISRPSRAWRCPLMAGSCSAVAATRWWWPGTSGTTPKWPRCLCTRL